MVEFGLSIYFLTDNGTVFRSRHIVKFLKDLGTELLNVCTELLRELLIEVATCSGIDVLG